MTASSQNTVESCFNAYSELATDQLTDIQVVLDLQSKTTEKQNLEFASEGLPLRSLSWHRSNTFKILYKQ